jgi:uncharacterized protein (DUF302 family)
MYGYKRQVDLPYPQAVQKAREELKKEGFGVLTEINVKDTLKKKLEVEFTDYIILGACNPPFAYKALQTEKDVGLMMPCNVVIYTDRGRTYVADALPTALMSLIPNSKLQVTAQQIEDKLKKVVDNITETVVA